MFSSAHVRTRPIRVRSELYPTEKNIVSDRFSSELGRTVFDGMMTNRTRMNTCRPAWSAYYEIYRPTFLVLLPLLLPILPCLVLFIFLHISTITNITIFSTILL